MNQEFTKYYSPIEFSKISDVILINQNQSFEQNNFKVDIDSLKNKSKIIILCTHCGVVWKYIVDTYLPHIQVPFIIISVFHDNSFPSTTLGEPNDRCEQTISEYVNIDTITSHKHFKRLFVINKNIPDNDKYTSIPYGLDYMTLQYNNYFGESAPQTSLEQDLLLRDVVNSLSSIEMRIPKIYANFHLNITDARYGGWRSKLSSILLPDLVYWENSKQKRSACWKEMGKYAFVLSPHGNGLDCIRTFEALCLGCIVILKTSCLDHLYEDLPVLIVNSYYDINEELLQNALKEFPLKKYNYDKLCMKYWINKVTSVFLEENPSSPSNY